MRGNIYLSHEGYEKIRKKLERLKTLKRKKLSKAIEAARAHGDISENAEYTAAKEAMALNEKQIAELEHQLSRAQILDHVWGDHVYVEERTVDVHIRRLRKVLAPSGHDKLIQTVRGAGYRLSRKN